MNYLFNKNHLRIVYYHMIAESPPEYYSTNGSISKQSFSRQLQYFMKNFNIISIDEATHKINNKEKFNNNLIITFDDGFSSIYHNAIPILNDYNIPSCVYLISDCVLKKKMMWRNILFYIQNNYENDLIGNISAAISAEHEINKKTEGQSLLKWSMLSWPMGKREILTNIFLDELSIDINQYINHYKPYMQKKELIKILNSGHTLGTHSISHPNFSKLNYDECEKEILESKKELENHLKCKIEHFSYPFGIRMKTSYEKKLISNHSNKIKSMAGIKFKFNEYNNPYEIERDKMEVSRFQSMLRLYAVPIARRLVD